MGFDNLFAFYIKWILELLKEKKETGRRILNLNVLNPIHSISLKIDLCHSENTKTKYK